MIDLASSFVNLLAACVALAATIKGIRLLDDYKSKVEPRLSNEEYLMGLMKTKEGIKAIDDLRSEGWSSDTAISAVRRTVTNKRKLEP